MLKSAHSLLVNNNEVSAGWKKETGREREERRNEREREKNERRRERIEGRKKEKKGKRERKRWEAQPRETKRKRTPKSNNNFLPLLFCHFFSSFTFLAACVLPLHSSQKILLFSVVLPWRLVGLHSGLESVNNRFLYKFIWWSECKPTIEWWRGFRAPVCVYMHAFVCVCVFVCICMYRMWLYVFVHVFGCLFLCLSEVCVHVCMCCIMCVYVCVCDLIVRTKQKTELLQQHEQQR